MKFLRTCAIGRRSNVSTLVVEWIEIAMISELLACDKSPPSWWSGLKSLGCFRPYGTLPSPPSWWSGLKFFNCSTLFPEIWSPPSWWSGLKFSGQNSNISPAWVSTLVVEWIEIQSPGWPTCQPYVSPPSWWSGLKSRQLQKYL